MPSRRGARGALIGFVVLAAIVGCLLAALIGTRRPTALPFTIGGWLPPQVDESHLHQYRDANFTVVIAKTEQEVALAKAQGLGTMLVAGGRTASETAEIVRRSDNVLGLLLWDEPTPADFPRVSELARKLRAVVPDKLVWINLHPIKLVPQELPGVTRYDAYLDAFLDSVKPNLLSYDNYGAMREANDDSELRKEFEESYFFRNMEMIRERALSRDLPFWGFALANPHWAYTEPDEADLRFQVYSLLAYGAKGIWYFSYRAAPFLSRPRAAARETGINTGLIDFEGRPTVRYQHVKTINREILALGATLRRLRSVSVHHLDAAECQSCDARARIPLPEKSCLARVRGGRPLVGLFQDDSGDQYFLVVNKRRHRRAIVSRIDLARDRVAEKLLPGHALGESFETSRPLGALALLLSSFGNIRTGALLTLRRDGVDGPVVAVHEYHNLFGSSAVLMRFPTQPPGRYYVELSEPRGSVGWWSSANPTRANRQRRALIAYAPDDPSADVMELDFRSDTSFVAEISKRDGAPQMLERNAPTRISMRLGDGVLIHARCAESGPLAAKR